MDHTEYFLHDYACLRIPSLPVESFLEFNETIKNLNMEDHEELIKVLHDVFSNTYYREAIYIASRDLYETFLSLKENNFANREANQRFFMTFYKYLSRMSNRSTPYGLFSGTSSVSIKDQPSAVQFDADKYKLVGQLNIHSLTKLIRNIDPLHHELINTIKYYKNNTLYILKDKAFFVEQFDNGRYIASNLTSIRLSEYVKVILESAESGATVQEMEYAIANPNITSEQKQNFIKNIVRSQMLVSELLPSVSTEDFIEDLLYTIDQKKINLEEINELKEIYSIIRNISTVDDIDGFRNYIENNPQNRMISNDFYKLDLFYNMQKNNVNKKVLEEISRTSYEVMQLFSEKTSLALHHFTIAFAARYEEKELPLTQVLDTNYGIGYEKVVTGNAEYMPLLDGIPVMADPDSEPRIIYGGFEVLREKLFKQYCKTGEMTINADEDVKNYLSQKQKSAPKGEQPPSAYIFGRILSGSAEALDNGDYQFFPIQCHAPFAARLLTRFTHGNVDLKSQASKIAEHEQKMNPDVILAEVLTIPDDNYANITLYPTIRDYEIPFLSNSKLSKEHQIDANDLMVSVRNGKVILRSKKLNKQIIPCLSNTYNTTLAQPLYKFLADVGSQSMRLGFFWDWGIYQKEQFLPRIEYKKMIVSRARWLLKKGKVNYKEESATEKAVVDLRKKYCLPQYVVLSSGDNELLLDLDNKVSQAVFLKEISMKNVILYENIHTRENCFIKEGGKSFANEIVIPMGSKKQVYSSQIRNIAPAAVKRVFPPGSEWLYLKIYSGSKNIEDLLTEVIADFAAGLVKEKIIDQWFFIKYNDPEHHIRVRFHCFDPDHKTEEWYRILENLQKAVHHFIEEEQAVRIVVDTYVREIERYGAQTMELSERIFFYDSVAVSEFLNLIHGNEGERLRWKFALVDVDRLLDDFKYSVKDKMRVIATLSENFTNEFSFNNTENYVAISRTLSSRHRNLKKEISDIIHENETAQYAEAYECFNKRSESISAELSAYPDLSQEMKDHLLMSYIHMTLNRLFMVNQRRHELVIYYFLKKFYESEIAKAKNNIPI